MAYDLETRAATGSSVYALIRNSSAQIWSTIASAFVAWVDANYANYRVALTEQGSSGFFYASMPSGISSADTLAVEFYNGTGIEGDAFLAGGNFRWTGSGVGSGPVGTALTSLAYVKDYCQITVSTFDTFLTNRIAAVSSAFEAFTNRVFSVQNYSEYLDGPGTDEIMVSQWPIVSVTSLVTDVYGNPVTIPASDLIVKNNGLISVKPNSTSSPWFPYSRQGILATYTAGYSPIPLDLQELVASAVRNSYWARSADTTLSMEKIGDWQGIRRKDIQRLMSDDIMMELQRYNQQTV